MKLKLHFVAVITVHTIATTNNACDLFEISAPSIDA